MTPLESHNRQRQEDKDAALAEIAAALAHIEGEARQPDHWERVHLAAAFTAIFSGFYGIALTNARLALTSVAERSPLALLPSDVIYDQCELPLLHEIWQAARFAPVKAFANFGPVEIALPLQSSRGKSWLG